jgi:hypothetical protein
MIVTPNANHLPAVVTELQQAEPDVLRSMLTAFVKALMCADADARCGAEYGSRSLDRTSRRNGCRHREWDTRAGTIELAIPKRRDGSYFPDWLLERRKRANEPSSRLSRPKCVRPPFRSGRLIYPVCRQGKDLWCARAGEHVIRSCGFGACPRLLCAPMSSTPCRRRSRE